MWLHILPQLFLGGKLLRGQLLSLFRSSPLTYIGCHHYNWSLGILRPCTIYLSSTFSIRFCFIFGHILCQILVCLCWRTFRVSLEYMPPPTWAKQISLNWCMNGSHFFMLLTHLKFSSHYLICAKLLSGEQPLFSF